MLGATQETQTTPTTSGNQTRLASLGMNTEYRATGLRLGVGGSKQPRGVDPTVPPPPKHTK